MKVNHNDKFLAKKVLLSVVAAGVMTGFVMIFLMKMGKSILILL